MRLQLLNISKNLQLLTIFQVFCLQSSSSFKELNICASSRDSSLYSVSNLRFLKSTERLKKVHILEALRILTCICLDNITTITVIAMTTSFSHCFLWKVNGMILCKKNNLDPNSSYTVLPCCLSLGPKRLKRIGLLLMFLIT